MGNSGSKEVADKYEICDVPLGQGTYGHVDKWRLKGTNKYFAVKTIDISNINKQWDWEREIRVWEQIGSHENVVPLLDHWIINDNIRAVMPLAQCNLSKYVRERRIEKEESGTQVDGNILVDMSLMLIEGTSHLHNSTPPIIHRDLKPANILCFEGKNSRIILKIADFGISKFQEQDKSADHTVGQGTKKFQAPEVIRGQKYSKSVDVWSLGVVLFYLTTGGEFPYFTETDDWHQLQQTINYQDLWKFSNSFFEMDDRTEKRIQDVINKMIVEDKRSRISVDEARREIQLFRPPVVVLSSTGPSAEWRGGRLGVYDYVKQHNNSPAYRQRHSAAGKQHNYLYRVDRGDWRVGPELGGSSSYLVNITRSDSVPTNNWLYSDGKEWHSDPELTVSMSTSLPPVCGVITISLHGAAARAQPETGGEYRATGDWSAGRPVFSNGVTYLCVRPAVSRWFVTDSPGGDDAELGSGCVTWCPASPRAAVSHRYNRSSWEYWSNTSWSEGDIRLTCDTHKN